MIQTVKFIINLQTARTLGLTVPATLLENRADSILLTAPPDLQLLLGGVSKSRALHWPQFFPSINEAHRRLDECLGSTSALFGSRLARIALAPNSGLRHFGRRSLLACFLRFERFSKKHHCCRAISCGYQRKHSREMRRECELRLRRLVEIDQ